MSLTKKGKKELNKLQKHNYINKLKIKTKKQNINNSIVYILVQKY